MSVVTAFLRVLMHSIFDCQLSYVTKLSLLTCVRLWWEKFF